MSKNFDKAMDFLDRSCDELFRVKSQNDEDQEKIDKAVRDSEENAMAARLAAKYR